MEQTDLTELDRLKAEMKRIIYLFSHDMRNPLINMKALLNEVHSSLEDVKQGDLQAVDSELADTMRMLDESVERMSAMIDGANKMYHCMFGPLECESVELKPLVERVLHRFADIEGVEVQVEEMPTLWADPLAVTKIVEELLKNSLWAIGREGSIAVSLNRQECFDELVIADSGIGVSEDGLKRLFDPFYSGSGQQTVATGMGLTLVKALAEAHGGSVRCLSKSGEGATFYISFPQRFSYQERP